LAEVVGVGKRVRMPAERHEETDEGRAPIEFFGLASRSCESLREYGKSSVRLLGPDGATEVCLRAPLMSIVEETLETARSELSAAVLTGKAAANDFLDELSGAVFLPAFAERFSRLLERELAEQPETALFELSGHRKKELGSGDVISTVPQPSRALDVAVNTSEPERITDQCLCNISVRTGVRRVENIDVDVPVRANVAQVDLLNDSDSGSGRCPCRRRRGGGGSTLTETQPVGMDLHASSPAAV